LEITIPAATMQGTNPQGRRFLPKMVANHMMYLIRRYRRDHLHRRDTFITDTPEGNRCVRTVYDFGDTASCLWAEASIVGDQAVLVITFQCDNDVIVIDRDFMLVAHHGFSFDIDKSVTLNVNIAALRERMLADVARRYLMKL
jgi:hypothetical protein